MFPSALCLLSDPVWRERLREAADSADQDAAIIFADREDASGAIEANDFDVLLLDLSTALDIRLDLLSQIDLRRPRALLGVVVDAGDDEGLSRLRPRQPRLILPAVPPEAQRLRLLFQGLASPGAALGLEQYLPPGAPIAQANIARWSDKEAVIDKAISDARRHGLARPSEYDIRLALEEIINNAVTHAFKTSDGAEKYDLSEVVDLDEEDVVIARYSVGPTWVGLSVSDNQGTLDFENMMNKFHRQVSKLGVTDESGRGIFLTRAFSDALIVSCVPGQTTEVTALFDPEGMGAGKSFCVCVP